MPINQTESGLSVSYLVFAQNGRIKDKVVDVLTFCDQFKISDCGKRTGCSSYLFI